MNRIVALLLIGLTSGGLGAQTSPVYRCGNAYSQTPCPQGHAIDADDARSAEQRAEAARVAADAKRSATQMEQERLAAEARSRPANAGHLNAVPPAATTSAASAVRHVKRRVSAAAIARKKPATANAATGSAQASAR